MQADKGHLHHRLLDMGLSQRQAVIIMYLISAVLRRYCYYSYANKYSKSHIFY